MTKSAVPPSSNSSTKTSAFWRNVGLLAIMLVISAAGSTLVWWLSTKQDARTQMALQTLEQRALEAEGKVFSLKKLLSQRIDSTGKVSDVILRLHGSNTIGDELSPALAVDFMQWLGANGAVIVERNPSNKEDIRVLGHYAGQPASQVIEVMAAGSELAFSSLRQGICDIGQSSRPIKNSEVDTLAAYGLMGMNLPANEHVIGLDGIAVVVHPTNTIEALDLDQVARVFSGQITDWSQLGGRQGAIRLYIRDKNSGTRGTFEKMALKGLKYSAQAAEFVGHKDIADRVMADPFGIGYVSLPYIQSTKALAIGEPGATPIRPTQFAVQTEDYAYSRRLYYYAPPKERSLFANEFLEYVHSARGQKVVASIGFIPLELAKQERRETEVGQALPKDYRDIASQAERLSVTFRFLQGRMVLDSRGERDLQRLSGYLRSHARQITRVNLVGYSDNQGSSEYILKQSLDRANMVRTQLLAKRPAVAENDMVAVGFGSIKPVASNATEEGRQRNNRVEVWVQWK